MRPIIFNPESVRAILEGRKTQTRRVIKRVSPRFAQYRYAEGDPYPYYFRRRDAVWDSFKTLDDLIKKYCPYGVPGDKLWVRETWSNINKPEYPPDIYYKADALIAEDYDSTEWKWKSPIYMPRWASRITLEIKDVRVERLKDLTDVDCRAEGIPGLGGMVGMHTAMLVTGTSSLEEAELVTLAAGFVELWDGLNAKKGYGWDTNPRVWVIEFEVM